MSESTVTPATETVEEPPTPDLAAELAKWKELSKKNEQRAKANADAAARLAEIEEAQKSAEQKAEEARLAAETRAQDAEVKAMRLEVALDKGIPGHLRGYVQGTTQEEIEASADKVLADFQAAKAPTAAGSIDQGARTSMALNGDPLLDSLKHTLGIP